MIMIEADKVVLNTGARVMLRERWQKKTVPNTGTVIKNNADEGYPNDFVVRFDHGKEITYANWTLYLLYDQGDASRPIKRKLTLGESKCR